VIVERILDQFVLEHPKVAGRMEGRRAALLAPVVVAGAVATSARGGWLAVAAITVLQVLNVVERSRVGIRPGTPPPRV